MRGLQSYSCPMPAGLRRGHQECASSSSLPSRLGCFLQAWEQSQIGGTHLGLPPLSASEPGCSGSGPLPSQLLQLGSAGDSSGSSSGPAVGMLAPRFLPSWQGTPEGPGQREGAVHSCCCCCPLLSPVRVGEEQLWSPHPHPTPLAEESSSNSWGMG